MHMPIVSTISFVSDALNGLCEKINKAQIKNLALIVTAMILMGTMCLSKIALTVLPAGVVNTLSHCFNYAGLDGYLLMQSAVRYAIKIFSLQGTLIKIAIDDTMKHHSKFCKTIACVYWLFDHVTGVSGNAKCIVFAYLVVNDVIRFPIGWRVFKQAAASKGDGAKAKDVTGTKKWELALELIDDAIALGLTIEVVLFDSWYCVSGMVRGLEKRNMKWISEIKSSQIVEFWAEIDRKRKKLSMSIAKFFEIGHGVCKAVELGLKFSETGAPTKVLYKTQEVVLGVKAFCGVYKLVRSVDERSGSCKIFITNELNWEAQKILTVYSLRWLIEEFFKNAKGFYGLEKACIRSEQGGALALFLVSFVDLLISIQLWHSVRNNPGKGPLTVSAIIAKAQEENLRNLIALLEDTEQRQKVLEAFLGQIQSRQEKRRKPRKPLEPVLRPSSPDTDSVQSGASGGLTMDAA